MCYFLDLLIKGKLCYFQLKHFRSFEICKKWINVIALSNTAVLQYIKCLFLQKLTSTCFDVPSIHNVNTCLFNQSNSVLSSPVRNETFMLRKFPVTLQSFVLLTETFVLWSNHSVYWSPTSWEVAGHACQWEVGSKVFVVFCFSMWPLLY